MRTKKFPIKSVKFSVVITDLIEPLSLDEAYLDVTTDKLNIGSAIEIATQIKQAIKDELQLTAFCRCKH